MSQTYGYARVSTKEQNTDRQYFALLEAGVSEKNLFIDKETGRRFNRKFYLELLSRLKPDDLLVITSVDRLGRDYNVIKEQWRYITQELQVNIRVLDMPMLDTSKPIVKGALGEFLSDVLLLTMSYNAESTWETIKETQRQGIETAKQAGKHLGRPKRKLPNQFEDIYSRWEKGEISSTVAMKILGLTKTSFYRKVKEYQVKRREI